MEQSDIDKINETIATVTDVVNSVIDTTRDAILSEVSVNQQSRPNTSQTVYPNTAQTARPNTSQTVYPNTAQTARPNTAQANTAQTAARPDTTREAILTSTKRVAPTLYRNVEGERRGGIVGNVFGYGLAGSGLLTALITVLTTVFGSTPLGSAIVTLIFASILISGGLAIGFSGTKKVARVKRFREYLEVLDGKTFMTFAELSARTGKGIKFLQNDIQDMIARKMFLQGHIDDEKTSLITSEETYKNYRRAAALQKVQRDRESVEDESLKNLSPAGREIVRQGEDYIEKIQYINTELPGEEITKKLQRLEQVIRRILTEVKRKPDTATDLRKLMNYYLPTTWKLLEAYKEIESEPVKTQQMIESQRNIETTLDTVNDAFENLLNQLFRSTAWDISSDISVLNTMLEREGLKDGGLQVKN